MSTRHDSPSLRLESDWTLAGNGGGILTLTLRNLSTLPLSTFRLAFTSLFPLVTDGQLRGATVVERISNYHVIAPPEGFVLESGGCWSASARLSHTINHYTSAVKSAYAILDDDRLLPVEAMATTRNRESGAPRLEPLSSPRLPGAAPSLPVVPFPLKAEIGGRRDVSGALRLDEGPPEAVVAFRAAKDLAARLFRADPPLFGQTGGITCAARHADTAAQAYRIGFVADIVTLVASDRAGFFYGFVTLGQILHAARQEPDRFVFPSTGEIVDCPRFAWRGMLLDVARQVFSAEDLLRVLDCLAWHKLNRFHLHLSDDEGWRLDIPEYPQLAERGGWRGHGLPIPPLLGSPPERYGMVYSRAEVGRLAARADELLVTVVPEIEMPGHSFSVLQALPELRDPADAGIHRNVLNPAVPATYEFLQNVLGEVASLFPSPWIHVGADEVPDEAWLGSPLATALMRKHGWQQNEQVQSYFLRRVQDLIRQLGRRTGAWQEAALGGGIDPRDGYLVAWRNSANAIALARQGYDVVLAPGDAYYLDMAQSDEWWEPGMDWAGTVSAERCYAYDPGAGWPDELKARLIGVQACLWSEHLHDRRLFDRLTVPRLSAVAESAWTHAPAKDFRRFATLSGLMPKPGIR